MRQQIGLQLVLALCCLPGFVNCGTSDRPRILEPSKGLLQAPSSDDPTDNAIWRLIRTKEWQSLRLGIHGHLSQNAVDVRYLIVQRNAVDLFDQIAEQGSVVSKLYSLVAYWYLSRERFQELLASLERLASVSVAALDGDIGELTTVGRLLRCSGNRMRLAEGAGILDFACGGIRGAFCMDITGGGLAIQIVEGDSVPEGTCEADLESLPKWQVSGGFLVLPEY